MVPIQALSVPPRFVSFVPFVVRFTTPPLRLCVKFLFCSMKNSTDLLLNSLLAGGGVRIAAVIQVWPAEWMARR